MRRSLALLGLLLSPLTTLAAPPTPHPAAPATAHVLMLSDIHFDPFRHPAHFAALNDSPASEWPKILATADRTPESDQAPEPCPSRGLDTDFPLFTSSLKAEQAALPHPAFITVSGDLMAHEFDCRYKALAGNKDTPATYSAFAAKTVAFVTEQLRAAFPNTPIYFTLGNNDSGCGDYAEDFNSPFLTSVANDFAATLPASDRNDLTSALPAHGGSSLPLPIPHGRLIILQNIFESALYKTCSRQPADALTQQIQWLRKQLDAARAAREHVWIMGHIPPAINVYTTLHSGTDVCTGAAPSMFLASEALSDVFLDYADIIKLTLFGHTHNDELHLYTSADGKRSVVSKVVPSITAINGNAPSFTLAEVNPATATLSDYTVITSSNLTGLNATWKETYRFTKTYGEPDFSPASLADLTTKLTSDRSGASPVSVSYQHLFFPGDSGLHAMAAKLLWPFYSCSITADHAAGYRACVCTAPAKP